MLAGCVTTSSAPRCSTSHLSSLAITETASRHGMMSFQRDRHELVNLGVDHDRGVGGRDAIAAITSRESVFLDIDGRTRPRFQRA